ncbi:MAG: 2Fe-2S iron-sulfur cluster binding domain-containing protein [Micromonosporaceae bacterium]|nr:2Fe-2S iron-sulfur cluster binding domain-containing protein [Micromonosporaceae bacterium]
MAEPVELSLRVNGHPAELRVDPRTTLADLLRDRLGLTGTHLGCEQGVCGSCTVLIDGRTARSCTTLAAQAGGSTVWTVEGLSPPAGLSRLQEALSAEHGLQCGFCTPGFVTAATELLVASRGGDLDEAAVRDRLSGNICRCTGYQGIVDAVLAVLAEDVATLPGADAVATGPDVGELVEPPELTPAPVDPSGPADRRGRASAVAAEVLAHLAVFVAAALAGVAAWRRWRR